jgi:hypothetical protein
MRSGWGEVNSLGQRDAEAPVLSPLFPRPGRQGIAVRERGDGAFAMLLI